MNVPSGNRTSTSRRLCSRAPRTARCLPLPRRRRSGTATGALAAQERAGDRPRLREDHLQRAVGDDLAAVLPRPGPDVDDPVRGPDRLLVVLHHEHGVAQVPQPGQRRDQLGVVPLVEPDRRLVEDVQDAHQRRADLRRQPDPLRLAAREADARPVQGQVVQPDVHEEPEPGHDLLEHLAGDRPLALGDPVRQARPPSPAPRSPTARPPREMLRPSTVTARTSGRRRRPRQVGHGFWTMNFSSSVRMYSDSVSLKRRSRLVTTPSNVAT